MKIERMELFHLRMPLVSPFETSFGRTTATDTLIIKATSEGLSGYGETPASAFPYYSGETVVTAAYIIKEFLAPRLRSADVAPEGLPKLFEQVRGNNMAKAGVEMALWDLKARKEGVPLSTLLGGKRGEIPTGISIGIHRSIDELLSAVDKALGKGYQRIKLKIKHGWDVEMLRDVRKRFPSINLTADANGDYSLADVERLKKLEEFNLTMLEQPLDHEDIVDHSKLQSLLRIPICLDESIRSPEDGQRAIELGSCKIINIKQARVGGMTRAIRLHDVCKERGVPVWCGGLLESGIGRAHNIALATLENFLLPGDISASERYYREDIIDPPVRVTPRGTIEVSTSPGIGHCVKEDVMMKYCLEKSDVL